MTAVWITIAVLTVGTFATKAAGTLVLGSHPPGERTMAMTALVAPALLAALVVYETFGAHGEASRSTPAPPASAPRSSRSSPRAPMLVVDARRRRSDGGACARLADV